MLTKWLTTTETGAQFMGGWGRAEIDSKRRGKIQTDSQMAREMGRFIGLMCKKLTLKGHNFANNGKGTDELHTEMQ